MASRLVIRIPILVVLDVYELELGNRWLFFYTLTLRLSLFIYLLAHIYLMITTIYLYLIKVNCSGMASFPSILTEEEEALQKKYAKLKKKVRHDPQFLYFFGHTTDIRVI